MRRLMGALLGLLVTACAWEASAQPVMFGLGIGGGGAALVRTSGLDARLAAAGRTGVWGPAGALTIPIEGVFGPVRLAMSIDAQFPTEDATRRLQMFGAGLLLGGRLREDGWVFLPSVGPSYTTMSLCVKGPAGAAPTGRGRLFDQILSAAGSGECLQSKGWGMRFELGVDREFWPSTSDDNMPRPGFYIGVRAGVTLPMEGSWRWGEVDLGGPPVPLAPTLALVAGFRIGRPD